MDSRGRFIVGPTYTPGEIVMYDRGGKLLRRFGRKGQGPGEFQSINRLGVGPGDSIHVFDYTRHTVLAPGLTSFVSATEAPFPPHQFTFLSDGKMVASKIMVDSRGVAEPLHIIDGKGEITRSFGGTGPWNPKQIYRALRAVAASSANSVWSGWIPEYRIELWTAAGEHVITLERDANWFRPWSVSDLRTPAAGLQRPRISGLAEDDDARLWVTIAVPNPDWHPSSTTHELRMSELDPNEMFDTVIEVLDPGKGRVIARAKRKGMVTGFIGGGTVVYTKREDHAGNTLIDVWEMRVER
jgi:hypothetical protein